MNPSEQQLFLIEFLVDKIKIPAVQAVHEDILPVTTCVCFQILSLPPVTIQQRSASDCCSCESSEQQIFRKGKSCLFALPSIVLEKPLATFPISVSVYKKLPAGVLPDVMLIGGTQIQAKDMINEILRQRVFAGARNNPKNCNPCKACKDTFKITTATGQVVGDITLFLRVSCFGKKIVTQFQIPHNKKPYLFKGPDDSPVFQCKRIPSEVDPSCLRCSCTRDLEDGGAGECAPPAAAAPAPAPGPCCKPKPVQYVQARGASSSFTLPHSPGPCCLSQASSPRTPKSSTSRRQCGCPMKAEQGCCPPRNC